MNKQTKGSKVVIIGAGNVGATIAYTLALRMVVSEIVIIDLDKEKALGEVMDLQHGMAFYDTLKISNGNYEDCAGADYIIITAGAKQKPDETRLQLTDRNKKILETILDETVRFNKEAFYLIVSNPVDILTYHTIKYTGLKKSQVFGTGTSLDTSRFKYLLGKEFNISPSNIHAYILGEHGDSSVPALSHANIVGVPLNKFKNFDETKILKIFEQTKNAAYEVIKRKGATFYAIALVVSEIVQSIEYDQRRVIPLSAYLAGEYGLEEVCLGVPCILGHNGIEEIIELELDEAELDQLRKSAMQLKQYII